MSNKDTKNLLNSANKLNDVTRSIESIQLQTVEDELDSSSDINEESDDTEQEIIDPELMKFSISLWYKQFKSCMVDTIIIDIPPHVLPHIKSDDEIVVSEDNDFYETVTFIVQIEEAIKKLGGRAYVKNNWHAPEDAVMFSLHIVQSAEDIINYFRASKIISSDFDKKLTNLNFCVTLRPWIAFDHSEELRCIVVHNTLIGVAPRDCLKYYTHFEQAGSNILKMVELFFEQHIKAFPENQYIFDIVYTPTQILLWDFGPLSESTKLYTFKWTEIKDLIQDFSRYNGAIFRGFSEEYFD